MKVFDGRDHIVAVVAHPDDAELMFYGTMRVARGRGAHVSVIVVTTGENGVPLEKRSAGANALHPELRIEESRRALGDNVPVHGLGFPDGALEADRSVISAIEATLTRLSPTVLLTHHPNLRADHQDHLAVGRATVNCAMRLMKRPAVYFGQPSQAGSDFTPNILVDITSQLDEKVTALRHHESQSGRWYLSEEFTRTRAAEVGWRFAPRAAADGHRFEALEQMMAVDYAGAH